MRWVHIAVILIITSSLTLNACAVYWSSRVDTNSSHWSIYRQSSNFSFSITSSVEGKISPVQSRDRILEPYQSYYEEIVANDLRLRERTNSLEGSYKSTDEIKMQSTVSPDEIEILVDKPIGTDVYTIEHKNELWPVMIKASRTIDYLGQRINDRGFEGNNGDFVGANFLYNRELSTKHRSVIWLQRMNATVLATNDTILSAELELTKYLGYQIQANSTGIADFSYRLRDSQYDVKHQNYPALSEGEERYYGTYDLIRKIEMRSIFEKSKDTDDEADSWLPCCSNSGWNDLAQLDKSDFGSGAKEVFDCTCYKGSTNS